MSNFITIFSDHLLLYWSLCYVIALIDLYICIRNQQSTYKLSNWTLPENPLIIAKDVLINQFCVLLPIVYMCADFFPQGSLFEPSNLYKIPITLLLTEILFYYTHVLFHSYYFWKYHSVHHTSTGPYALCTFYCHPLEMALVNIAPLVVSALVAGLNFQTMRLWHMVAVTNTVVVAHGGFKVFGNKFHDLHHQYKNCNYGLFEILDKAHGTYVAN